MHCAPTASARGEWRTQMAPPTGAATPTGTTTVRASDAALRYGVGASFEDKVAFLTEQLAGIEHVGDWKLALKSELAKREYSLEQLQNARGRPLSENPLLCGALEKLGLINSLKRAIIDLHYAVTYTAAAGVESDVPGELKEAILLPDMLSSHGCALDVVFQARENWETITRDEMLRFASELGRPLVVASSITTPSSSYSGEDPQHEQLEPDNLVARTRKLGATRFLYDGYGV